MLFQKKRNIISALDIGSSNVMFLIAEIDQYHNMCILGVGHRVLKGGILSGNIIDVVKLEKVIGEAIADASEEAKSIVDNIYVTISLKEYRADNFFVAIDLFGSEVIEYHLRKLASLALGEFRKDNAGYEELLVVDHSYKLDNEIDVASPEGRVGDKLSSQVYIVYISSKIIQNLTRCIERTFHSIEKFVPINYATIFGILTQEDKKNCSIIIDIGDFGSNISIYYQEKMVFYFLIPIGGRMITNDIKEIFDLSFESAEKIKNLYGDLGSFFEDNDYIELKNIGISDEESDMQISKASLNQVIKDRVEEILFLIKDIMLNDERAFFYFSQERVKIFLTGGTANLLAINKLASDVLEKKVVIGKLLNVKYNNSSLSDPIYSTVIGLLNVAYKEFLAQQKKKNQSFLTLLGKIGNKLLFENVIVRFFQKYI